METKSVRELEIIIQRLKSQIDTKNGQIAELNSFIQSATANTQELIKDFRGFCIKVLESELAYGDITSKDLESMSLNELLQRAKRMLKQNQEKARGIYDTFKERLMQKNEMIQGLTDQVAQLKFMLDNAEKMFNAPYEEPEENKRTSAYLLDTDTPSEALRPSVSLTTVLGENERVVNFAGATDKDAVSIVSEGKMVVQNIDTIMEKINETQWSAFELICSRGISEIGDAKTQIIDYLASTGKVIGSDTVGRIIKHLTTLELFSSLRVNTGIRWFNIISLTETGRMIYINKYKKNPAETEAERIIKEHGNLTHGYMIKDAKQILEDTGKYRTVSMSRRSNLVKLNDGRSFIPDIICCQSNSIEYYEVECGNHHQSDFNDKCNKLRSATQNLYFIGPNKEKVDSILRPQIEAWIESVGKNVLRIAGVVVYLTTISDLASQKWSYVFNMKDEKPICCSNPEEQKEAE